MNISLILLTARTENSSHDYPHTMHDLQLSVLLTVCVKYTTVTVKFINSWNINQKIKVIHCEHGCQKRSSGSNNAHSNLARNGQLEETWWRTHCQHHTRIYHETKNRLTCNTMRNCNNSDESAQGSTEKLQKLHEGKMQMGHMQLVNEML